VLLIWLLMTNIKTLREYVNMGRKYNHQTAVHYHLFLQSCQRAQTKLNQSRLSSNFREPFSRGIPLRKQEPEGFRRVLFSCTCWLKQIWKRLHCSAVSAISRIGVGDGRGAWDGMALLWRHTSLVAARIERGVGSAAVA